MHIKCIFTGNKTEKEGQNEFYFLQDGCPFSIESKTTWQSFQEFDSDFKNLLYEKNDFLLFKLEYERAYSIETQTDGAKSKYQCVSDNDFFWFEVDGIVSIIGGHSLFDSYQSFVSIFDISKPKQLEAFLELNPLVPEFFKTHQNQGFYMVYVQGECNPTYKHDDHESAMKEAKRLSAKTGKRAYILLTVTEVVSTPRFSVWETIAPKYSDELPF
jgi:hypothetical protein